MRKFEVINNWVDAGSKVLVLGCGNGDFLRELSVKKKIKAFGIDIDSARVGAAMSEGLSVLQGDINTDLSDYPEKSFDYVIAHDIIQIMKQPDVTIREIIKLGNKVIISFPNFAYFPIRLTIMISGRMPKTKILPYEWYDTPNIHLFTIKDFKDFCKKENLKILKQYYTGLDKRKIPFFLNPNFLSEFAYFLICKN